MEKIIWTHDQIHSKEGHRHARSVEKNYIEISCTRDEAYVHLHHIKPQIFHHLILNILLTVAYILSISIFLAYNYLSGEEHTQE
jgi:ABC-type dipeptide/oligopeptide/nickel transport system permease subunit